MKSAEDGVSGVESGAAVLRAARARGPENGHGL